MTDNRAYWVNSNVSDSGVANEFSINNVANPSVYKAKNDNAAPKLIHYDETFRDKLNQYINGHYTREGILAAIEQVLNKG